MMLRKQNLLVYLCALAKGFFGRITGTKHVNTKTMQNPNKYNETLKQHILAAGIISAVGAVAAGALKLDQYLGSRDGIEDGLAEPELIVHHPDKTKALVLLGGLCMSTNTVAKRFKSQLADDISLIAPIFPDTGFNPITVFERTYQKLEETNPDEVILAGLSMGGPLGWDWLDYGWQTGRQDLVKKVSTMALWGSPMDKCAIRPGPRSLISMVETLGYSYILNHSRPLLRRWNLNSIANAPSAKIVPQCKYLAGKHAGELPVTPDRVVWFRGMLPDPVVNEDRSIKILEQKLGFKVEQIVDQSSTRKEHVPTNKRAIWFMLSQLGIAKSNEPVAAQKPQMTLGIEFAAA
jgi:hypothetical protein